MKKMLAASVVAVLCHVGIASAGVPGWCKEAAFEKEYDLKDLSSQDVDTVVSTLAMATCKPTPEASAAAAQIDGARQAWGKKLSMTDADWADAVAYANVGGRVEAPTIAVKDFSSATALDQYATIVSSMGNGKLEGGDYATDVFESNLTEVGRFAYVNACVDYRPNDNYAPAYYAQCQGDIDAFDRAKFATQLRGDTGHPGAGAYKMDLRLRMYSLTKRMKAHADEVQKIIAKDPEYKKLWAAAAKGRAQFASTIGTNKELLALALKMDSANEFKSRKLFDGCEVAAQAAFEKVVKEKVPASLFKDVPRDEQLDRTDYVANPDFSKTFASRALPVMATIPELMFVNGIYQDCDKTDADIKRYLQGMFRFASEFRGPRRAALDAMKREKIVLDDVTAKIEFPSTEHSGGGGSFSSGGTVDSVEEDGDHLTISLEANTKKEKRCIKEHYTKKVLGLASDGSVRYELLCDKYGMVEVDHSGNDVPAGKRFKPLLKKGVQFSVSGSAVVAVWPNKKATVPSHILGVPVK